jgi:hypothetical protein
MIELDPGRCVWSEWSRGLARADAALRRLVAQVRAKFPDGIPIRVVFGVLAVLMLAAPALAQGDLLAPTPAPPTPAQQLATEIAAALAVLVGSVVSAVLVWLGAWIREKFKVEIAMLKEEQARGIGQDAALAVEEWAAQQRLAGVIVDGEAKVARAAAIAAPRLGASLETARRIVESVLPALELGAAAGLRALREAGAEPSAQPGPAPGPDDRSLI